jgi:hypothetical protein
LVFLASEAHSQVSATNLVEAQSGNTPFMEPENRFGFYNQLNVTYSPASFLLGVRFESDHNTENTFIYDEVTQRYAEWRDPHLRVRAGNFYTILGRGLIHRSFELPGVVLDTFGQRSRYTPSRDVDGILIEGSKGSFSARAFSGSPSGGTVSPGQATDRMPTHAGQSAGAEISAAPFRNARLGAIYGRFTSTGQRQFEYGSGFLDLDPLSLAGIRSVSLPVYAEYAREGASFGDWWTFATNDEEPHALYAGMNLIWGSAALSAEWKDYSAFRLGTNDPPSLVKEHSWPLLNRATHVLDADGEQGFQLEATWAHSKWGSMTANVTRSDGRLASRPARFEERYVEVHLAPSSQEQIEATLFYDDAQDGFQFTSDRRVYGGSLTLRLTESLSATLDFERLHAKRGFVLLDAFTDQFSSLSLARTEQATLSLIWEKSTDPEQRDPEAPLDPRHFVALVASVDLSERHEAVLFFGERRGGRACTAGTCYEVMPFKGAEVRLTSRF